MKKILLIAFSLLILANAKAQEANNTLKINPISALLRTGSVFYERKLNENSSLQLGAAFTGFKLDGTSFTGIAITPEYRHYFGQKAVNGVYAGPFLRYQDYTVKDGSNEGNYTSFGGGLVFGRQWVWSSGFVLDLFFGPSYNNGNFKLKSGNEPDIKGGVDGFGIRTGISLGIGF